MFFWLSNQLRASLWKFCALKLKNFDCSEKMWKKKMLKYGALKLLKVFL